MRDVQIKNREASSLAKDYISNDCVLFCLQDDSGLAPSSRTALSIIERLGVDARIVLVAVGSALEGALHEYSGWQFLPQLYVAGEFIGGSLIMEEFFASGEFMRMRIAGARSIRSIWRIDVCGTFVAVARANGTIEVVNAETHRTVSCLCSHAGWVNSARFVRIPGMVISRSRRW